MYYNLDNKIQEEIKGTIKRALDRYYPNYNEDLYCQCLAEVIVAINAKYANNETLDSYYAYVTTITKTTVTSYIYEQIKNKEN